MRQSTSDIVGLMQTEKLINDMRRYENAGFLGM